MPDPDLESIARAQGYGWNDIDDHIQDATGDALQQGYSADDVNRFLGFNPDALDARAYTAWSGAEAPQAPSADDGMLDLSGVDWRGGYANAMREGEVRGPYDWADNIAAHALDRMQLEDEATRQKGVAWATRAANQMTENLPGRREFTDAALALTGADDPSNPDYENTRRNLIDHWQDTGQGPTDAFAQSLSDPALTDKLTTPPSRGVLGEIGAAVNRWRGDLIFGLQDIGTTAWKGIINLTGSEELKDLINKHTQEWAKREQAWHEANQRGEGLTAFLAGTIGETVPTIAEYLALGLPRAIAYGALHGASVAWERTGSATAAAAGALISGAEAGAPVPLLKGAAGQGMIRAAVKSAIGAGGIGVLGAYADPLVDAAAGKGYVFPDLPEVGERAAAGAISGALLGSVVGIKPKVRRLSLEPETPDAVVNADDNSLQPTPELHDQAFKLSQDAARMEQLRLEREGLVPGNATESGNFFSRKAAEEGGTDPYDLAEGYRAANTFRGWLDDLLGPVWRDQTGSLSIFGERTKMRPVDVDSTKEQLSKTEQILRREGAVRAMTTHEITEGGSALFKHVEPFMGEWKEAVASKDPDRILNSTIGKLKRHMDGEEGFELPGDHPLRPVADALRTGNLWQRAWLENSMARGEIAPGHFVTNFWKHLWKDPEDAERKFGSAFGKQRTVPLWSDGIKMGLRDAIDHPIEHQMYDMTRKAHMIGRQRALAQLSGRLELDHEGNVLLDETGRPKNEDPDAAIVWRRETPANAPSGLHPIAGLTKQGSWTERQLAPPVRPEIAQQEADVTGAVLGGARPAERLGQSETGEVHRTGTIYAYSRYQPLAKMVREWNGAFGDYPFEKGSWVEKFNYASNALTGLKMIWPGFHMFTVTAGGITSGVGNAMREILHGEFDKGIEDVAKTIAAPAKIAEYIKLAQKNREEMAALARSDPDSFAPTQLQDFLLTGGFRYGRRQGVYLPGRATNIVTSLMRGSLGREVTESFERYSVPGAVLHEFGRLLVTTSAPAFDMYIPLLKEGVQIEAAQTWLRQNPTASREQLYRAARQIVDNTDDRLGELNLDNVFWRRWTRALATKIALSPGWVFGTIRETAAAFGFRIADARSGWEWNPTATTNLVAAIMVNAGLNMLYQYIKTGRMPGDVGRIAAPVPWNMAFDAGTAALDLLVGGRTGGMTKGFAEARGFLPGEQKEYLDWAKIVMETYAQATVPNGGWGPAVFGALLPGLAKYATAKERNVWQTVHALVTGQDAIGRNIAYMPGGVQGYILDQMLPIFANAVEGNRPSSGISAFEQGALGIREVPDFIADPQRFWSIQQYLAAKRTMEELRNDRRRQFWESQ